MTLKHGARELNPAAAGKKWSTQGRMMSPHVAHIFFGEIRYFLRYQKRRPAGFNRDLPADVERAAEQRDRKCCGDSDCRFPHSIIPREDGCLAMKVQMTALVQATVSTVRKDLLPAALVPLVPSFRAVSGGG